MEMETVTVDAKALKAVLSALDGPPHYIRELQVTRGLPAMTGMKPNPINILMVDYLEAVRKHAEEKEKNDKIG